MDEGKGGTVTPLRCCVAGCKWTARLEAKAADEPPQYVCNRHLNLLLRDQNTAGLKFNLNPTILPLQP